MAFTIKSYLQVLADIQNWIIANQDKISDFNEGGALSSELEAFSQEMEEAFLLAKSGFSEFLIDLPFYAFNFARQTGLAATGEVVFSRSSVAVSQISIPVGTVVGTEEGVLFTTTEAGTISIGNTDSNSVIIQAQEVGVEGNVKSATVTTIVTPVVGVETVTNANACTGGQDGESDSEFLKRFRNYILGLGKSNSYGLRTAAQNVEGVRSASVDEHNPPDVQGNNVTLYVEDGSGTASAALISDVEDVIEGDGTTSNPGYRAAGIKVKVDSPTAVTQDVTASVQLDGSVSEATVEYNLNAAITTYINGLLLGEDVVYNTLVRVIMSIQGVRDVTLTTPSANVTVNSTQIARVGTITLSFVVV